MAKNKSIINSKGQGMSMNVIIIAVIALIVLVVLLYIFNDKINIFGKGISDCKGECKPVSNNNPSDSCTGDFTYSPAGICKDKTQACCIRVYQQNTQ